MCAYACLGGKEILNQFCSKCKAFLCVLCISYQWYWAITVPAKDQCWRLRNSCLLGVPACVRGDYALIYAYSHIFVFLLFSSAGCRDLESTTFPMIHHLWPKVSSPWFMQCHPSQWQPTPCTSVCFLFNVQFVQDTGTDKHKHEIQSVQKEEHHKGSQCRVPNWVNIWWIIFISDIQVTFQTYWYRYFTYCEPPSMYYTYLHVSMYEAMLELEQCDTTVMFNVDEFSNKGK